MLQSCSQFICQWENEPGGVPLRIKHLLHSPYLTLTRVISLIYHRHGHKNVHASPHFPTLKIILMYPFLYSSMMQMWLSKKPNGHHQTSYTLSNHRNHRLIAYQVPAHALGSVLIPCFDGLCTVSFWVIISGYFGSDGIVHGIWFQLQGGG